MSSLPLQPIIDITQSYPGCNLVKLCDQTPEASSDYPKGYGPDSIERSYVTKTRIYVGYNGGDLQELLADFLPVDNCITFDTNDLEVINIEVPNNNCCGCPPGEHKLGGFSDGCWEWIYEVYGNGEYATYDLSTTTFPDAFKITINSMDYILGYIPDITTLINKLNALGLGIFTLSAGKISVTGNHVYGNIVTNHVVFDTDEFEYSQTYYTSVNSSNYYLGAQTSIVTLTSALNSLSLGAWIGETYTLTVYGFNNYGNIGFGSCLYDISGATFSNADITIHINGINIDLGPQASVTTLLASLNVLQQGTFIYDSGSSTIFVYGLYTYGVLDITNFALIDPECTQTIIEGVDETTFLTTTVVSEDVLLGVTTINKFFSCNVSVQVKNILLTTFASNCSCNDPEYLAEVRDIDLCYQTMLLASQTIGCNCDCSKEYLFILQKKLASIRNNCQ